MPRDIYDTLHFGATSNIRPLLVVDTFILSQPTYRLETLENCIQITSDIIKQGERCY